MKISSGELVVIIGSVVIIGFAAVVGSVIYLKPPPVQFTYTANELTTKGEVVYRREGCLSCHEIFGNGASYGPSLDGVGSKRTQQWLRRYMMAPWPGVSAKPYRLVMPPYDHLAVEDMDALVAYLKALKVNPT